MIIDKYICCWSDFFGIVGLLNVNIQVVNFSDHNIGKIYFRILKLWEYFLNGKSWEHCFAWDSCS